jgi:hypothetical protein
VADEYLVYDRRTGTVRFRYSVYRPTAAAGAPLPGSALLQETDATAPTATLAALVGGALSDVGMVLVDADQARSACRVDPETEQVVPLPRLVLSADRAELEGDGEDTARIAVSVVDADGTVLGDRTDTVRVTTSRGKLSSPGGVVVLRDGAAEISLRSVPETVPAVYVRAESQDGGSVPGRLTLEFR